ncbi:MAG: nicotinate phosphoribosyltransferase [Gemmatimonadetes bacterium]|nr:nicotinate phosphoribosyltransferase [Gemmatimonadota bacterium]
MPPGALFTDLYQLTMAQGYWRTGVADRETVFHLWYRRNPFAGGYALAAGMEPAIEYLRALRFLPADLTFLASLTGADGGARFDPAFLRYLQEFEFRCDVDMVPEGTVVFPQEPLVRVCGPVLQAQLIETALLNQINFSTLVATKAARICHAAGGAPVLEFGLRRAQGADGGLSASRAAYIGGCAGTSNVLAGQRYGIPVRGTHAHSWVRLFGDEAEAFARYAAALPNNVVLLVDTFDSLRGVRRAIAVGRSLREHGHRLLGIRLDSGDLAHLSREARRLLDDAGFQDTRILASNDLDEETIADIRQQGGRVDTWAVGTRLVTGHGEGALGGVYKLSAVRGAGGEWEHRVKLSEQTAKVTTPGCLQVRRFRQHGEYAGDAIYDTLGPPLPQSVLIVDPADPIRQKRLGPGADTEDLLVPVFRNGAQVYSPPPLGQVRDRARTQLAGFHEGIKRFHNPHRYPAGLESGLYQRRAAMLAEERTAARAE